MEPGRHRQQRRGKNQKEAVGGMTAEDVLIAVRSLKAGERVRLISQLAPEICRAAMDDPQAITMMLAECRHACQEPEARRRMEFAMGILGRMKGGA